MIRCKYAGDSGDEYCVTCDGLNITMPGHKEKISCTSCAGYEAGTETAEEMSVIDIATSVAEAKPPEEEFKEDVTIKIEVAETPSKSSNNPPPKKSNKVKAEKTAKAVKTGVTPEIPKDTPDADTLAGKFHTKSIRLMSGRTDKIGDTYYKFSCEEEIELAENVTEEDVNKIRKALWDKINDEVDNQFESVIIN